MKSTQTHFLEQLDDAFTDLETLASWTSTAASNVGIVSVTDRETGAVLASVHLDIQAAYAKAKVTDHMGHVNEVFVGFTPEWLTGNRALDPPTGVEKIVTLALDATGDCSCIWTRIGRTPPRDEQYGNGLCLFHNDVETIEAETVEHERITDMASDR